MQRMNWSNDTPVIIYGAAHAGILVYNNLKETCNFVAFIDKRADELSCIKGLPVYTIDSEFITESMKHESIVVVCVTNIFDHENITVSLVQHGFSHVVFCPVDGSVFEYRSKDERDYLSDLYKHIYAGDVILPVNIPLAKGLFYLNLKDSAIISQKTESITANIPSIFAFTRKKGNGEWENSPMLTLFPYLEVHEWFSGNTDAKPEYYIDLYCSASGQDSGVKRTLKWERNIINSRKMAYERMRISEELVPSFFEQLAVPGIWNCEGHFNMVSGKHRAAYLIQRRKIMIPLVLSESDYQIFLNESLALKLINYCKRNSIFELPYPVYSPLFYSMPFVPEKAYYELLLKISRWLAIRRYEDNGKFNLSGLTVYDETQGDFLPILLALAVFGCNAETAYPISEFDEIVGSLYHLSEIPKHSNDRKKHYNVIFTGYDGSKSPNGADYFVFKMDNSQHLLEEASRSFLDFKVIHVDQDKLFAVGKGIKS